MKKLIICFICSVIFIESFYIYNNDTYVFNNDIENRSIFISYIELNRYIKNKSISESKNNISIMIKNINNMGFNEIILQVRSFSDSIYKSNIYPWSSVVSNKEGIYPGYDILDYFIKEANKYNISIIGWINPFRVRSNNSVSSISINNPAYRYIGSDVLYINNGIYYNPSKKETISLLIRGIDELLDNYNIKGILFDDYFYPDNNIDIKDYNDYIKNNSFINKDEYNLMIINNIIKEVHKVCIEHNVLFGVSPDGNISNNYSKHYSDVRKWGRDSSYVDFIMPQVYYGFDNQIKPFINTIYEWDNLIKDKKIKLRIALSFYKVGNIDKYAKSGMYEWCNNRDIIMRQVIYSRKLNNYGGISLFRYDNLFNKDFYNDNSIDEIINLQKVLS